ncbi:M3 family oligoendopeptidase [Clostridium sp. Marseille-P2415]|uniref:M3 family oligoendopeptidase n=1 Tax=Clostridium sp. Marseille-P2415 TaxID=1805471 RepID=UPI0009886DCA|nr:M3 family oligoendopeptidase [Clostridium sp. Marseille-P2415]
MKFKEMPYQRVDLEEKKVQFEELMKEFAYAKSGEAQFEVHKKYYKFKDEIDTMITIAKIRHDIDTTDDFYEEEQNYYDETEPELIDMNVIYARQMYESPYRTYLEEKIGAVAFKNIQLNIRSFDKKLIPLKQEENVLTTAYDKLIASAEIDWEGETLNLSLLRKYLTHKDKEVRQKAYTKYCAFFEANGEELDSIYDKLVKNRTKQAQELGHDNFVELGYDRVKRNCYGKDMVENFRKQVKEYFVPFAEKLHERRKNRLGLEKLSCIDEGVFFADGNPEPIGTPEEIMACARNMYGELSKETKEFFDFMSENELFDVLGRKKKRAGGYMTYLPDYNSPFIFANFNGTSKDINVITHECGHAFQGYLSGKDPIKEHADITMETAEIHSMSMEFFTEPWMNKFFGNRTDDYLSMHLEDAAIFIPYGCMVDEFQHIVYENPHMTPAERHNAWKQLEKEYRPHLDYTGFPYFEKGGFWQKQPHIYDDPFYYIDYCIAQICAFQYKIRMDENYREAWDSYLKLCTLSASDFFTNMLKEAGLASPFEDGCVKRIVEKLETLYITIS